MDEPIEGLISKRSAFSVRETISRLERAAKAAKITVFARIDHAAGASAVDMPLRPTMLLIFGHPKGGTPLMQRHQSIGIDLPQRALAWQDEQGVVWLSYNAPDYLARRHGIAGVELALEAMKTGLEKLTDAATTAPR